MLAKSPKATLYTGGSDGFVSSTTAPIATGWSDQLPGGIRTHWKSPPLHGALSQRIKATVRGDCPSEHEPQETPAAIRLPRGSQQPFRQNRDCRAVPTYQDRAGRLDPPPPHHQE